jgi:ubiquinone/menaquinone biosynthesis C-methylase UbiE
MRKFTEGLLDTERIINSLDVKPGMTIIDAGCGTGYMTRIFSQTVSTSGNVYAIDRDSCFIEKLSGETRDTNIQTIHGDITRIDRLTDNSADLIYVSAVIHALPKEKLVAFWQEAKRLLKVNALLAIVEIVKKETPFGPAMENRYSPEELTQTVPMVALKTIMVGEYFYLQVFLNAEGGKPSPM